MARRIGVAFLMALWLSASAAAQEAFPTRAITLVVPGQAGSTTDATARAIAQQMTVGLGQPVLVDNRPGASGAVGMQYVAKAKPDGYTLAVVYGSIATVPQALTKVMPYDMKDFVPVSLISTQPLVLLASADSKIDSVKSLVALAKVAPGQTNYGNSASMFQLAMEMFNQQAGTDILGINYKGPTDAAADLIGGRLQVTPDSLGSATARIQTGRVKAIGMMAAKRHPAFPDVPTFVELGYQGMEFEGWGAIMAPIGTSPAIVRKLNAEIVKAIESDAVRKQYATLQVDPVSSTPEDLGSLIERETIRYEKIARGAKIEKK